MLLSDKSIKKRLEASGGIVISPYNSQRLQPASYDLSLSGEFKTYTPRPPSQWGRVLSLAELAPMDNHSGSLVLPPLGFALAATAEWLEVPPDLGVKVEEKSSIARLGIFVHITAGFIDPGFRGSLTLEMFNASPTPRQLFAGDVVAQIAYYQMTTAADRPYGSEGLGSHYQGQRQVTEAKIEVVP